MNYLENEIRTVFTEFIMKDFFLHPNFSSPPSPTLPCQTLDQVFDLEQFTIEGLLHHYIGAKALLQSPRGIFKCCRLNYRIVEQDSALDLQIENHLKNHFNKVFSSPIKLHILMRSARDTYVLRWLKSIATESSCPFCQVPGPVRVHHLTDHLNFSRKICSACPHEKFRDISRVFSHLHTRHTKLLEFMDIDTLAHTDLNLSAIDFQLALAVGKLPRGIVEQIEVMGNPQIELQCLKEGLKVLLPSNGPVMHKALRIAQTVAKAPEPEQFSADQFPCSRKRPRLTNQEHDMDAPRSKKKKLLPHEVVNSSILKSLKLASATAPGGTAMSKDAYGKNSQEAEGGEDLILLDDPDQSVDPPDHSNSVARGDPAALPPSFPLQQQLQNQLRDAYPSDQPSSDLSSLLPKLQPQDLPNQLMSQLSIDGGAGQNTAQFPYNFLSQPSNFPMQAMSSGNAQPDFLARYLIPNEAIKKEAAASLQTKDENCTDPAIGERPANGINNLRGASVFEQQRISYISQLSQLNSFQEKMLNASPAPEPFQNQTLGRPQLSSVTGPITGGAAASGLTPASQSLANDLPIVQDHELAFLCRVQLHLGRICGLYFDNEEILVRHQVQDHLAKIEALAVRSDRSKNGRQLPGLIPDCSTKTAQAFGPGAEAQAGIINPEEAPMVLPQRAESNLAQVEEEEKDKQLSKAQVLSSEEGIQILSSENSREHEGCHEEHKSD